MSFAKRIGLLVLALALASIVVIFLSPVLVGNGLRLFLWWKGREEGLKIAYQKIEAPFLKPVVIEGLHVTSAQPCAFRIDLSIPHATIALNLRSIFLQSNTRILHQAWIDSLRCEIRRDPKETAECKFDWRFLHRLLADEARLSNVDLHFVNGATDFTLRGAVLTASEIESGKFAANKVTIAAPFFHQTFTDLRGATKWENDHLTVGALSLTRGLDVQTITADFSRLEKKRIGVELNLDAFGGRVRASIASENREKGNVWDVAGSASAISLAQMSAALGLPDPAGGAVHAGKFTFRGDLQNLSHATASVWIELSGFTWRDRVAETVMLGASLYNRQVEVQQLYVKQRTNQLTLTGEYTLPQKSADWINPNFRADIAASVTDLGEFARLFGGTTNKFAGALTISGTVNGRDRNFAGQITAAGDWLKLWGAPVDELRAKLTLKNAQLNLDSLQAHHQKDFFNATGEVDLLRNHAYSIKTNGALADMAEYQSLLPETIAAQKPHGRVSIGWDGHGTAESHSGKFQIQAENVRLTNRLDLQPFDAKIAGTYSPESVFCRDFRFFNPRAALSAFFTIAPDHLQLQSVQFELNGVSRLHGDAFIPVAFTRWWREHALADFDPKQSFGVDLALDALDLAELQGAVSNHSGLSGNMSGRLEMYGPLEKLRAKCDLHAHDFSLGDPRRASVDFDADVASSLLRATATVNSANSSPAKFEAALPLQLNRENFFAWDKPMTFKLNCPALLLSKMPPAITRVSFREGILTANVEASGSLRNPTITGNISCLNARFARAPGTISGTDGQIDFRGPQAVVPFAHLNFDDTQWPFHGTIDFTDSANISITLVPDSPLYELNPPSLGKCIGAANIFASRHIDSNTNSFDEIAEVRLHARFRSEPWTMALEKAEPAKPREDHSICESDGEVLQLAIAATPKIEFGQRALRIFRGSKQRAPVLKQPPQP